MYDVTICTTDACDMVMGCTHVNNNHGSPDGLTGLGNGYYNGQLKATIKKSGSGWYFKSGDYLQTNTSRGDKSTAAGVVVTYALDVTHS